MIEWTEDEVTGSDLLHADAPSIRVLGRSLKGKGVKKVEYEPSARCSGPYSPGSICLRTPPASGKTDSLHPVTSGAMPPCSVRFMAPPGGIYPRTTGLFWFDIVVISGDLRPILINTKPPVCGAERGVLIVFVISRPGSDLLSHVLRRSTIGAEDINGRVRDGIGFGVLAIATGPANNKQRSWFTNWI